MSEPLRDILERLSKGTISLDEAVSSVRLLSYRAVGDMAKIDPHRKDRIDVPEAILAEGKAVGDLVEISLAHLRETGEVMVTRVSDEQMQALCSSAPKNASVMWKERCRILMMRTRDAVMTGGVVGVLTAGTADISVAEEAGVVAEEMGCKVVSEYDVGVAGIHRLFPSLERMIDADAIVVAAGREGTLPAVVAGLVDAPVIGLPVSTGYGLGGNGVASLMSMLQSCSVLAVVNIDAGFVAGAFAAKVANQKAKIRNVTK